MCAVERLDFYRLILRIMFGDIHIDMRQQQFGIDLSHYAFVAFVQHLQHAIIYIVVNQYNLILCLAYAIIDKDVSIKHLPIVEDALCRLDATIIQTSEDFFEAVIGFSQTVRQLFLMRVECQLITLYDIQSS